MLILLDHHLSRLVSRMQWKQTLSVLRGRQPWPSRAVPERGTSTSSVSRSGPLGIGLMGLEEFATLAHFFEMSGMSAQNSAGEILYLPCFHWYSSLPQQRPGGLALHQLVFEFDPAAPSSVDHNNLDNSAPHWVRNSCASPRPCQPWFLFAFAAASSSAVGF